MKLTPEDLQRIEDKKVANILRKIYTEKRTPTAREDAILKAAGLQTGQGIASYVQNWDDLAKALGVSRRAIQDWRKDPRYMSDCPPDRADGRKEVSAWLDFMIRHGLKRADQHVSSDPDDDDPDADPEIVRPPRIGGSQADWNKAASHVDYEKKSAGLAVLRGTLLEAAELEGPLGATFASIQSKLAQFPARVARYLVGLRDVGEVEDKLRDELDADLADLHSARYTAPDAVAEAVGALPFDEETERLFALVVFEGQDRVALLQLITAVADQALRQLGRRAIAAAREEREIPDLAITDEATGQVSDEAAASNAARRNTGAPASESSSPEAKPPRKRSPAKAGPKKKKRSRPKPTSAPAEIEGAIHTAPRPKAKRARPR